MKFCVFFQLTALATKLNKGSLTFPQMCGDPEITAAALKTLQIHGNSRKLIKFEIPGALTLCCDLWTPESGLVTSAFKLKRKPIQERYQDDINKMYKSL